jgi:signal transduction histidine kinase
VKSRESLLEADEFQLQRILTNFVINAEEAMAGRGTITISAQAAPRDVACGPDTAQCRSRG